MSETPTPAAAATAAKPSCALPRSEPGGTSAVAERGLLGGGCCADGESSLQAAPLSRPARRARATAGLGFLALAGALGSRQLPGRIALWPAALVPTWFGISHLVAGVTGYRGCPELGAIPSVLLDRPVTTNCGPWERIDRRLGSSGPREPACCA
jgi:hypothetical protein